MKKKLIALAAAGAFATPMVASAQGANATISGRVQAEYSLVDFASQPSRGSLQDNSRSSRWGLQISEDLDNGYRTNTRLGMGLNACSGSATTTRKQWVGLSGNQWHDVKFGRVQSLCKDFAGGMTINPFAYTTLQASGTMSAGANGMGPSTNGFVSSAIRYDSATIEGFSFSGLLVPGDANMIDPLQSGSLMVGFALGGLGSQGNVGGRNVDFDSQDAAKYHMDFTGMGLDIFGGYSRHNANGLQKSIGLKTEGVWRVGGAWTRHNFKSSDQYENIGNAPDYATCSTAAALVASATGQCNSATNRGGSGNIWFAGAQYRWGNTALVLQDGMTKAHTGGVNDAATRKADSFTVGAIHNLSRRASVFGGY